MTIKTMLIGHALFFLSMLLIVLVMLTNSMNVQTADATLGDWLFLGSLFLPAVAGLLYMLTQS